MSAQPAIAEKLPPGARRLAAMVVVFALAAPPLNAIVYLGIYATARWYALALWDLPTLAEFIDYLPDIYAYGIAAALAAGLILGWRQTAREAPPPLWVVTVGVSVGLVNGASLLALSPDFGPREVAASVLFACHTLSFVIATIVCWRVGDLVGRVVAHAGDGDDA